MIRSMTLGASLCAAAGGLAHAQGPVFQTPGMPQVPTTYAQSGGADAGQANRFSSAFNPAFSFVIDALGDYLAEDDAKDGANLELRTLEVASQAWVDPSAWAYFVAALEDENLAVEEAAVHYTGLGGNHTLRAGRFFVDFGKQMQTHVHELRTVDRPLVLRTFLGEEVKGDGVQWDSWTSVGDTAAVRWSIGVFANLLPEADEDAGGPAPSVADRKDAGDLNFTARVTGFGDAGENGTLQLGASARVIPQYAESFDPDGDGPLGNEIEDLESTVYGLDATYGWVGDSGLERWTFGAEYLLNTGDTTPLLDAGETTLVAVDDDEQGGFYVFGDWQWDRQNSVGVQWSQVELPLDGSPDANEIDVYYTRSFSEFHRLRFAITQSDVDDGADSTRFAIQYTAFVGAHGHGVNW